jgi:hypothetical protein
MNILRNLALSKFANIDLSDQIISLSCAPNKTIKGNKILRNNITIPPVLLSNRVHNDILESIRFYSTLLLEPSTTYPPSAQVGPSITFTMLPGKR